MRDLAKKFYHDRTRSAARIHAGLKLESLQFYIYNLLVEPNNNVELALQCISQLLASGTLKPSRQLPLLAKFQLRVDPQSDKSRVNSFS